MTQKIEALAFGIARTCGGLSPDTEAYQLNNPLRLRAFSPRHEAEGRLRKFDSWQAGFKAACFDLDLKCRGESRCKVSPRHTLAALCRLWEIEDCRKLVNFLRRALRDETINEDTLLEYFNA